MRYFIIIFLLITNLVYGDFMSGNSINEDEGDLVYFRVDASNDPITGETNITSSAAGNTPLTIIGAASQTADLIVVKDSGGNTIFNLWSTGHLSNIAGMNGSAAQYGTGMLLHNYGEQTPEHTNIVGSYDNTGGAQEQLFTKTSGDDFTQADADNGNWLISLDPAGNIGATAEIKVYLGVTQVIVDGMGWTGDLASQTWAIFKHPVFIVGDGNKTEFSVGTTGEFEIASYDFTGSHVAEIELDAAVDNTNGLVVECKANGYTSVATQSNTYHAGDLAAGEVGSTYLAIMDDTGATSADATTGLACYAAVTTGVSSATNTAFIALPGFTNALVVQGASAEDPDYGYETTSGTSTDRVNSGGGGDDAFLEASATNVTIFESVSDDILIGSDATFEDIEVILATDSSKDLTLTFWYSKAGGNWTSLVVQGDGTDGMQHSGNIIFNAPGDWTKDDEDIDGNAITDAYYVAITRTVVGAVPTLPVEDYFKTFADQATGMSVDGGGFVKPRNAADASAPNNSIYYSSTQSKLVYKDSGSTVHDLY
jgi:hypothetical protein